MENDYWIAMLFSYACHGYSNKMIQLSMIIFFATDQTTHALLSLKHACILALSQGATI